MKQDQRSTDPQLARLRAHHRDHGTIPAMAGLARLWGYASKSSASRRVDRMLADDILVRSADRRIAPGPDFAGGAVAEPLDDALVAWRQDYDPALVRSYAMTARLLRLAQSMERGMAASAAREGLTSGDAVLLDALHRVGPPFRATPTALKRHFLITLAGVGKRVNRLEALGLVARAPDPEDRRGRYIKLTGAGHAVLDRLVRADAAARHIM